MNETPTERRAPEATPDALRTGAQFSFDWQFSYGAHVSRRADVRKA